MPKLPIETIWLYTIHLLSLLIGVLALRRGPEGPALTGFSMLESSGRMLAFIAALACFTFVVSEPPRLLEDFNEAYLAAGEAVLTGPAHLDAELARGVEGFVNLPLVAYLFAPLALLPGKVAAMLFTLVGLAAIFLAWWFLVRALELDRNRALLLLLVFAAFGPLHNSVKEGNTSHFILALLAAALLAMKWRREFSAGVLLGAAALLKLPLLLFGLYYFLRGRWRIAVGGSLVCGVAALASIAIFGWQSHIVWYSNAVAPFSEGQILAFNVQSIRGLLGRLTFDSSILMDWRVHELPAFSRSLATAVNLVLFATTALAFIRPLSGAGGAPIEGAAASMEFSIVLLLACLTSPLSWSHYYTWALVPIAVLLSLQLRTQTGAARLAWLAIFMCAPPVLIVEPAISGSVLYSKLLVSHYVVGALLMTGLLLQMRASLVVSRTTARAPTAVGG